MRLRFVQKAIDKIRKKEIQPNIPVKHEIYGKMYYPIYNLYAKLPEAPNNIYNEYGEKLHEYFLRDSLLAHCNTLLSRYYKFDRYNFGLKTHFYTHESLLQTMGNPDKRYGCFIESETIVPNDYKIFDKHKGLEKDFDLIFTFSDELLNKLDNARFVPFSATNEVTFEDIGNRYQTKTKNISMLSSGKTMCELHKYRIGIAKQCRNENLCDTFGTFDGGVRLEHAEDALENYRFTIIIENDIKPYYFTERLITAFAMQTIPIYCGATKIHEFYNSDGIIKLSPKDDIKEVLKQCTEKEYNDRLSAVLDNYQRWKNHKSPYDYLYEKYIDTSVKKNGKIS